MSKAAKKTDEFKELNIESEKFTFFKFEEEQTIEGNLEKVILLYDNEKGEKVPRWLIRESDEGLLCMPNHGGLNYLLKKANELGAECVQITYNGLKKVEGKKHKVHDYSLKYK